MPQTIVTRGPILAVTERPTTEQWQVWWEAMQRDNLSVAYADSFPATLTDFRREVAQGEKPWLLSIVDGQIAGQELNAPGSAGGAFRQKPGCLPWRPPFHGRRFARRFQIPGQRAAPRPGCGTGHAWPGV